MSRIERSEIRMTSPTAAAGVTYATHQGFKKYAEMSIDGIFAQDSGGTLDFVLQRSPDGGTTWIDWLTFTQLTAGSGSSVQEGGTTKNGAHPGDQLRLKATPGAGAVGGFAQKIVIQGERR